MSRAAVTSRPAIMTATAAFLVLAWMFFRDVKTGRQERDRRICHEQLRDVEGAKEQYALDHGGVPPASWDMLIPAYLRQEPRCPHGHAYILGDLQQPVACPEPDHALAW